MRPEIGASPHVDPTLSITLEDLPPLSALQPMWERLQGRARHSVFTSWLWIGSWLEALGDTRRLRLLCARREGRIVGLAVVGLRNEWRFGLLPLRSAHLNETGVAAQDAIAIEYNDCLLESGTESEVRRAMLLHVMSLPARFDEFRLAAVEAEPGDLPADLQLQRSTHPVYHVDLQAIEASGKDYLGCLSQRQRYLVRRGLKRLAARGGPSVVEPDGWDGVQADFEALCRLHTRYWNRKGEKGAFGTPFQRRFHAALLRRGWSTGAVRLLRIQCGSTLLGSFYYLCHDGRVHYYQSGIDYSLFAASDSPGLAAHALAIEYFRAQGIRVYDFMAGDNQYKRTLSTHRRELSWLQLQRRNLRTRAGNLIVSAGRCLRQRLADLRGS